MKPNASRYGGLWSLVRTAGLLVSLVGSVGFGAQGCSANEESDSSAAHGESLIGGCDDTSESCPEALTGTCGLLYCSGRSTCSFKADLSEGEKCKTDGGATGVCLPSETPGRVKYLTCCSGCIDRDGRCRAGDTNAYCGTPGDRCDTCGSCSSCTDGKCLQDEDGTSCSNGGAGRCVSGTCCTGCIKAGTCYLNAVDNCGRSGGACTDCDDDKPCTADSCNSGTCAHTNVPGACDPGDACVTGATCSGSTCTGQPKVCNDNNDCTTDSCDPATGCKTTPLNSGSCNDGNACTDGDSCAAGDCAGTPVVCNDNNPCTNDTCDPDTGCKFTNLGENVECDDGNDCSTGDRCTDDDSDGVRTCVATGGRSCNDDNPCTQDFLANCSDVNCTFQPITGACSTGDLCKQNQACDNGTCGGGTDIDCDDDNPCTVDSCDPEIGCVRTPQAGACNDGNPCTIDDACDTDDGSCVGTAVTCAAAGECYLPGECNQNTGTCSDLRKPDDTECGTTGTCQSGQCVGDGVVTGEGGAAGMGSAGDGNSSAGTGGSGNGNAGGGGAPGNGEGGSNEPGSAGESSSSGSGGTDTVGSSGSSNGSGATPGDAGQSSSGEIYVRDPGGCACSVPGTSQRGGRALGMLGLALGLAYAARRRRHATF